VLRTDLAGALFARALGPPTSSSLAEEERRGSLLLRTAGRAIPDARST